MVTIQPVGLLEWEVCSPRLERDCFRCPNRFAALDHAFRLSYRFNARVIELDGSGATLREWPAPERGIDF